MVGPNRATNRYAITARGIYKPKVLGGHLVDRVGQFGTGHGHGIDRVRFSHGMGEELPLRRRPRVRPLPVEREPRRRPPAFTAAARLCTCPRSIPWCLRIASLACVVVIVATVPTSFDLTIVFLVSNGDSSPSGGSRRSPAGRRAGGPGAFQARGSCPRELPHLRIVRSSSPVGVAELPAFLRHNHHAGASNWACS